LLVLLDMRELGDLTEKEHRLLAWYVQQSADHIVLIGNYMENYLKDELLKIGSTEKDFNLCKNSKEVWKFVDKFLSDSDEKWIILIKGSQNTIFLEEATKALLSDKSDEKYLTRQSKWRLDKKNASFN
jgi:UDP-N-acetylmuramyl pentapeptide synthase